MCKSVVNLRDQSFAKKLKLLPHMQKQHQKKEHFGRTRNTLNQKGTKQEQKKALSTNN